MPGLSVGCSFTASMHSGGRFAQPDPGHEIEAFVRPASSRLYEGQAVQDMAGFKTMIAPANFRSTGGLITKVQVVVEISGFDGTPTVGTGLGEGDRVSFLVLVSDEIGTMARFSSLPITVEYKSLIRESAGNEANIEINPLVPDEDVIEITILDSAFYVGTYAPKVGDLRGPEPYNFADTITVSSDGNGEIPLIGDTFTIDRLGLWNTTTSDLTLTSGWQVDGQDVALGAVSYTVRADDTGKIIRAFVEANDGENAPMRAYSRDLEVMPAAQNLIQTLVADPAIQASGDFVSLDMSAASEGDTLLFLVGYDSNGTSKHISHITLDGEDVTGGPISESSPNIGRTKTSAFIGTMGANSTPNVSAIRTGSGNDSGCFMTVFKLNKIPDVHAAASAEVAGGQGALEVMLDTADTSIVFGVSFDGDATGARAITGFSSTGAKSDTNGNDGVWGVEETTTGTNGLSFSSTSDNNPHRALTVVCLK